MQCFEYQMMLSHIYHVILPMQSMITGDIDALDQILDKLGVKSMAALLAVDDIRIRECAFAGELIHREAA